jgi:hypothetical protein
VASPAYKPRRVLPVRKSASATTSPTTKSIQAMFAAVPATPVNPRRLGWAGRTLHVQQAQGIALAALDLLARHFGYRAGTAA